MSNGKNYKVISTITGKEFNFIRVPGTPRIGELFTYLNVGDGADNIISGRVIDIEHVMSATSSESMIILHVALPCVSDKKISKEDRFTYGKGMFDR